MKSRDFIFAVIVVVGTAMSVPTGLSAQDDAAKKAQHHHYKLIDLGTFGGPVSRNDGIYPALNNSGTVIGGADTNDPDPFYPNFNPLILPGGASDPYIFRAFQSNNGQLVALESLPGGYSTWPSGISKSGLIAGEAINGALDPITGWPEETAVFWQDGKITNLGTLGGYESGAGMVNSRGQVTGASGNAIPDPYSLFGLGTQTRAFIWDRKHGMQDLGTLGGPDAASPWINEGGQIAGSSYTNYTPNPTTGIPTLDPFLWEKDTMVDLGSLGGTLGGGGDGVALNNKGQVVGSSNLAGDVYFHPFLWAKPGPMQDLGTLGGNFGVANAINDAGNVIGWATNAGDQAVLAFFWRKGIMTNLGALPGDICSYAFQISPKDQVTGASDNDCAGGNSHGFLWENGGPMADLNDLVTAADMTLIQPTAINDAGEISSLGVLANGDLHAFLLIPCDDDHPDVEGCDYSMVDTSTASVSPQPTTRIASPANQDGPAFGGAANPMLRRFGRRFGPWNRGMGAERPAVKPTSAAPAGMTTQTSADGALEESPSCSPGSDGQPGAEAAEAAVTDSSIVHGYCSVSVFGQGLDGGCVGRPPLLPFCIRKGDVQQCPIGAKAKQLEVGSCGHTVWRLDVARPCSFRLPLSQ